MNKKLLIALADTIREHNSPESALAHGKRVFTTDQIRTLADFCEAHNSNFKRDRWLDYIAGKCGPNGGVK